MDIMLITHNERQKTMSDTTATVRAEILEEEKNKIDIRIEALRQLRETCYSIGARAAAEEIDKEIDALLIEKDNLSLSVPSGWIEDAEADAAEARADARERADLYEMGMGR